MVHDFEDSQQPLPGHAQVCVVGAGAAGILIATQLAAAGVEVVLLEGGGLEQEERSQAIYRSEVTGLPHKGIHEGRFRTYGGTTTRWGGQILELDAFDFTERSHVKGSGWPVRKAELTQAYARALEFEGLRRVEHDDSKVRAALGLEAIDLGDDFSMHYSYWCPERNFARLHERELTTGTKVKVFTHANVVAVALNESRTGIAALHVRSFGGRTARVTADHFVLCLGGIESTRLLLQPLAGGTAPWQENGLLGRHYQDHIGLNGIGISYLGPQKAYRYFGYVESQGFGYHSKIGMNLPAQEHLGTLNVACTIGPIHQERPGQEAALHLLRRMVREGYKPGGKEALHFGFHLPGLAARLLSQRYRGPGPEWKTAGIAVHCEQSPLSGSRISLSDHRDELGLLQTSLRWEVSDFEIHSIRSFVKLAATNFAAHGLARIHIPKGFLEDDGLVRSMCGDSNHHMGGTRMAESARDGIVDANLKLHGIANGYVCSASVFPTSGFSNPTHTVLALAVRLADRLTMEAGRQTAPTSLPQPMRTVALPGSGRMQTQLGFGCAYLLGAGVDRSASLRLLGAAYDAGIRHFDTARLYGQGRCEELLGEFLRQHPDATVTTKFGLTPPSVAERALGAAQRRLPGLPGPLARYTRNDKATFNAAEARVSLERSLKLLQRERIQLLLLHEAEARELVHDDLVDFLQGERTAGRIGDYGIGGEYRNVQALYDERPQYTRVLQFEWSIFGPGLQVPNAYQIHYRTFAKPAQALGRKFAERPDLLALWSDAVNADLGEPRTLSHLLLKASLDAAPNALTLFSTRREEHILDNAVVAGDSSLSAPAARLIELVRQDDLGLGRSLYP